MGRELREQPLPPGRAPHRAPGRAGGRGRAVVGHPDLVALALLLLVGAALRLYLQGALPVFMHGDSYQYYRPGYALFASPDPIRTLVSGEGSELPLKRPPAYPVFLALVSRAFGEGLGALSAVQHLLGLGTVGLSYALGRLTVGRIGGIVGGLTAALAGGILIYEQFLLTETLFSFLLTLGLLLYVVGLRTSSSWSGRSLAAFAGAGLVLGLAVLTRVHAQILLMVAPFVAAVAYRRWCPAVGGTLVAVAAAGAVMVPWMWRNQQVHGDFTVAARSGQSLIYQTLVHHPGRFVFYDRDNPPQDEDDNLEQARKYIQRQADLKVRNPSANVLGITIHAWLMENLDLTEAEANDVMTRVALDAIRARPAAYAEVILLESREVFFGTPDPLRVHWDAHHAALNDRDNRPPRRLRELIGPATPEQQRLFPLSDRLTSLYHSAWLGPLVPLLFMVGLVAAAVRPAWRLLLVPGLAVLATHGVAIAVVGFSERYRTPVEPLVHIVAAAGAVAILSLAVPRLGRWYRQRTPAAPDVPGLATSRGAR